MNELRPTAVAVLHAGGMHMQLQSPALRVDQGMLLAALDLLARVIAENGAALGRLDALAVNYDRRRARPAFSPLSVERDQAMDAFPRARVAQPDEPAINRAPRWEAAGRLTPGNAAAWDIVSGIYHLAHRPRPPAAEIGPAGQRWLYQPPFGIRGVASIA
jgi:hypothetical protein